MSVHAALKKKLITVLGGFGAGTLIGVVGMWVLNSSLMTVAGLGIVLLVIWHGSKVLRCPYCQKSIYQEVMREASIWISRLPRQCPLCGRSFMD